MTLWVRNHLLHGSFLLHSVSTEVAGAEDSLPGWHLHSCLVPWCSLAPLPLTPPPSSLSFSLFLLCLKASEAGSGEVETPALPRPGPSSGGVFSNFFRFSAAFSRLSSCLVKTLVLNTVIACGVSEFADVGDSCRAHSQSSIQKRREV